MRSIQPAHPTDSVCKFAFVGLPCPFMISLLSIRLGDELNNATGIRDLLLGLLADVSCADDDGGLGQAALSEELGVSESIEVDERGGVGGRVLQGLLADVGGDQRPQLVDVDLGLPLVVPQQVEAPHTDLTEVTRVVLVKVGSVVVLATGHTTTTGVLSVLANATVTGTDMAAVLARLGESGRHLDWRWVW